MRLAVLQATRDAASTVDVFSGLNHNTRINDGEWYDAENLTSDAYPVMKTRAARKVAIEDIGNIWGVSAQDKLCILAEKAGVAKLLVYDRQNGVALPQEFPITGLSLNEGDEKQLVPMGAWMTIWPDGKYVNLEKPEDKGSINNEVNISGSINVQMSDINGTTFTVKSTQKTAPSSPADGDYWMDTSGDMPALKQWSAAEGLWASVLSTYVKLSATGIGKGFAAGDGVKISGFPDSHKHLNMAMVISKCDNNSITVGGVVTGYGAVTATVKVSRKAPIMDYVIEHDNRLWGCRFGVNADGEMVNEIYASKLGDFKNWFCYQGVSTDSYAVSLGHGGKFCGAVSYAGYPTFFREDCMHRIYGSYPAQYALDTTECRGVMDRCSRSMVIVNNVLYYKSRYGYCAYDGSLPHEISENLGEWQAEHCLCAAGLKNKYYAVVPVDGDVRLFVYDTRLHIWHKESKVNAYHIAAWNGDVLAAVCGSPDRMAELWYVESLLGNMGREAELEVPWMAETGIINVSSSARHRLKRLSVRIRPSAGVTVQISAQYDSYGDWEPIGILNGVDMESFTFPVKPRRCDHMRLRFEANGECIIYAINKVYAQGSDVT